MLSGKKYVLAYHSFVDFYGLGSNLILGQDRILAIVNFFRDCSATIGRPRDKEPMTYSLSMLSCPLALDQGPNMRYLGAV